MSKQRSSHRHDDDVRSSGTILIMHTDRQGPAIALVNVGRTLNGIPLAAQDSWTESLPHDWTTKIPDESDTIAQPPNAVSRIPEELAAALSALPDDIAGVIVVGADAASYELTRTWARVNHQCAVVTDQALTAVAATAELLTTLTDHGLPPRCSRVVIAGAATAPLLGRLLMVAGISAVTNWDRRDAVAFPLHLVIRDADAAIDLLGCP